MLRIGLTGGIGSGKTVVSDHFRELGVPVIDTDVIARDLVTPGSEALDAIVKVFGAGILNQNRELDRKRLGQIVFSDPEKKASLEEILHPRIRRETLLRIQNLNAPYCVIVVPLLIETDFVQFVDRILVVDAPDQDRIRWIKKRSGLSEAEIRNIFAAQTGCEDRLAAADYVVTNDGTLDELRSKVADLHIQILVECDDAAM
ncbi:dephospho-CoA kinase [Pseudomonadota bacterium]